MPNRKAKPLRAIELLAAIGVIALIAACGIFYYCTELLATERCYDNVFINGEMVGGLTLSQIREKFKDDEVLPGLKDIEVKIDESVWTVPVKGINARYDVMDAEQKAMDVGRSGSVVERLSAVFALRTAPKHFSFNLFYDEKALSARIDQIYEDINVTAENAKLDFQPQKSEMFVITNEVYGKTVDKAVVIKTLKQQLANNSFEPVTFTSEKRVPEVTGVMLEAQSQLLASYTTELTDDKQRNQNIVLAGEAVNGTVLQPGEIFSFNKATGERSSQSGYVAAPTIANKQLVDAPGGGVCQVSTTIYNAVLLAGMKIVERYHHSWPVFYTPAGQDSTVDYGRKDLRFQNNTDKPVYIVVKVDLIEKTVIANVYGKQGEESIQLDVQNLESIKPDRAIEVQNAKKNIGYRQTVTKARDGCRVKVYRVYLKDGAESRRELISEDYYTPVQGVIEVGSKTPRGGDPDGEK